MASVMLLESGIGGHGDADGRPPGLDGTGRWRPVRGDGRPADFQLLAAADERVPRRATAQIDVAIIRGREVDARRRTGCRV
jgi:hypothetical protein